MSKEASDGLRKLAKRFALACTVGVLLADIYLGSPSSPEWWLIMPFALAWQAGPILLAAACAALSRTEDGQRGFLLLACLFLLATGWTYYEVLSSTSSTASIALVFMPLYLYGAWLLTAVVAGMFGWHARDFGSANPPPPSA